MRRIIAGTLALTVLSSTWLLGSEGTAKKKKAAVKKVAGPTVSQQMQSMKDQLNQQQQQINQLQQQLQQSNQSLQSAQQSLQSGMQKAAMDAQAAQAAAAAAQQSAAATSGDVAGLKTTTTTLSQSMAVTDKAVKELQSPLSIKYKGVSITPIGIMTGQFEWWLRNQGNDLGTSFTQVPLNATSQNVGLQNFRGNARAQSRLGLLVEGYANPATKLTGYIETDFGSTVAGPNAVQSSPFLLRLRQAWAQIDKKDGLTLTVGQDWVLWTPNRKGIATRQEWIPIDLEYNILVGYPYKRQPEFRVTKNWHNKVWAAIAIESTDMVFTSGSNGGTNVPTSILGLSFSPNAAGVTGGGIIPQFNGFNSEGATVSVASGVNSFIAPDVIAKVAFDPGWGHYELKGIGRFFRDRVQTAAVNPGRNGYNNVTEGYGIGGSFILPVTKKVDFVANGQAGAGIGSYNSSGSVDTTLNNNFQLVPVKSVAGTAGIELHPSPKLDVYAYAGDEYYAKASYHCTAAFAGECNGFGTNALTTSTTGVATPVVTNMGYGNPLFAAGTNNRDLSMASFGYYYRFFRGSYGTFQQGLDFNYYWRSTWGGVPQASAPGRSTLKGYNDSVMLDIRYVLP